MSYTTSCKDCVFAEYQNNSQVGCHVRLMDENEYSYAYEDSKEYRVYRRLCQFKRKSSWKPELKTLMERCKEVDKEVEIKYNVIVYERDKLTILDDLAAQTIQPQKVIIIEHDEVGAAQSMKRIQRYDFKSWTIHNYLGDVPDWRDDIIIKYPATFFVFIKDKPIDMAMDFFEYLNYEINHGDLRFGCIESDDILIFPLGLYKMVLSPIRDILENMETLGAARLKYEDLSSRK